MGLGSPHWSWTQLCRPRFQPIRVRFIHLIGLWDSVQTRNDGFVDVSWFMTSLILETKGLKLNVASLTSFVDWFTSCSYYYVVDSFNCPHNSMKVYTSL